MRGMQAFHRVPLEDWVKVFLKLSVVVLVCSALLGCLCVGMGSIVTLISYNAEDNVEAFICLSFLLVFYSLIGVFRSFLVYKSAQDTGFSVITFFSGIIAGTGSIGLLCLLLRKMFTVDTAIYYIPISGCLLATTSFLTITKTFTTTSKSFLLRGYYLCIGALGFTSQLAFLVFMFLMQFGPYGSDWLSISSWCYALLGLAVSFFVSSKVPEDEIAIFSIIKSVTELVTFGIGIALTKIEYDVDFSEVSWSDFWSSASFIALLCNIGVTIGTYYLYYLSAAMCFQLLATIPLGLAQVITLIFFEWYACDLFSMKGSCGDLDDYFWVMLYFAASVPQLLSAIQLFKWNLLPFLPISQIYRVNHVRGDIILPALILNIHNPTTKKEEEVRNASSCYSKFRKNLVVGAPLYNETQLEIDSLLFSLKEIADNWRLHYDTIKSVEFHITIDGFIDSNKNISGVVERLQKSIRAAFKLKDLDLSVYNEVSYGGRKVIKLNDKATLTIHGKYSREDENKLVNRGKRQSLILFFNEIVRKMEIKKQVEHTYLLTIDGDTNFKSEAVKSLINKLDTNPDCGAVCGKIVPRGTGALIVSPLVAFQIIEYALGHWLTKEMEEIFGSILCSPGCFSLIRLSEVNKPFTADPAGRSVLDVFAKKGSESADFLKYDMGEDRLLCTLLLLNQASIRYVPSATALTYCPEEFEEFFNQRRRWIASTLANMVELFTHVDLLMQSKSFSYIYLAVQVIILLSGVVSIAIILLLLTDALVVVFGFPRLLSLLFWMGITLIYCASMLYFENPKFAKEQQDAYKINISKFYTLFVTLGNIVVVVAITSTAVHDPLNVASIMLYCLVGSIVIAFILHPGEFHLIIFLPVYVIFLPAAYLVLPLYAFCNMVDTRWGTRAIVDPNGTSTDNQHNLTCFSITIHWIKQLFYFLQQLFSVTLKSKTNTYQLYIGAPILPADQKSPPSVMQPVNYFPAGYPMHYPPYHYPAQPPTIISRTQSDQGTLCETQAMTEESSSANEFADIFQLSDSDKTEDLVFKEKNHEQMKDAYVYYEDVIVCEEGTKKEEELGKSTDSSYIDIEEDFSSIIVHDLTPVAPKAGGTMDEKLREELLQLRKDTLTGILIINAAWILLSLAVDYIFTSNRLNDNALFESNGLSIFFLVLFGFVFAVQVCSMIYFSFVRFFYWITISVSWNLFCCSSVYKISQEGEQSPITPKSPAGVSDYDTASVYI